MSFPAHAPRRAHCAHSRTPHRTTPTSRSRLSARALAVQTGTPFPPRHAASDPHTAEVQRLQRRVAFERRRQRSSALCFDVVACTRTTPCSLPALAHAAKTITPAARASPLPQSRVPRPAPIPAKQSTREFPKQAPHCRKIHAWPHPATTRLRAVHVLPRWSVCSVVLPSSAAASATAPSSSNQLSAPRTTP
jgi:hypothetical protein